MIIDTQLLLMALAALFVLDAFYSGAETAMTALNHHQLDQLMEEHPSFKGILTRWRENHSRLLTTILVSSNLTVIGFSSVATALSLKLTSSDGEGHLLAAAAIYSVSALLIICAEIAPKIVAKRHAAKVARWILPGLRLTDTVLGPLIRVVVAVIFWITKPFGDVDQPFVNVITEEDLIRTVNASAQGGAIEVEEKRMIESIIGFGDLVVRDVMIPRTDLVGINLMTSVDKILEKLIDCGFSRLPVYDKNFDNIIGILYAKDFLAVLKDKELIIIQDVIRPAYYVPETKKITELLTEFKRGKIHLAVVVDEYGGTSGLVTLEDLVEEIVGDIKDEYDHEPELLRLKADGSYEADAGIDIEEINERLGLTLPDDEETNSLGGFLSVLWKKVPAVGEEEEYEGTRFKILNASETRVDQVRIILPEVVPPEIIEGEKNGIGRI